MPTAELASRQTQFDVKHLTSTATGGDATTLTVQQQHVECPAPLTSGIHTITLPGAEEAAGRWFYIRHTTEGAGTITVNSPEPTPVITGSLSAAEDEFVAYSTGFRWLKMRYVTAGVLTV